MPDPNRIYPPLYSIMHNSVSPEGYTRFWSDEQWAQWFSDIGRTRTYGGVDIGLRYKGKVSYSAIQYCVVPNGDSGSDGDIYKDTWRVVACIDNASKWVTWHAGNWDINRNSDGYEFYGRYDDKELPDNAVKAYADHVRDNIEKLNGGRTIIKGHKQVSQLATGCPNRMMDKLELAVDMINNPQKYTHVNVKVQPKPNPSYNEVRDVENKIYVASQDIHLQNVITKEIIKSYPAGSEFEISATFEFEGVTWGFTEYSWANKVWNGFNMNNLKTKENIMPLDQVEKEKQKIRDEYESKITSVRNELTQQYESHIEELKNAHKESLKQADSAFQELYNEKLKTALAEEKLIYETAKSELEEKLSKVEATLLDLQRQQIISTDGFWAKFFSLGRTVTYFLTNLSWISILGALTSIPFIFAPGSELTDMIGANIPWALPILAILTSSQVQAYFKNRKEELENAQKIEMVIDQEL